MARATFNKSDLMSGMVVEYKNGKRIFEGDIVRYQPELWCEPLQSVVEYCADKWNYPAFTLKDNYYEEGNELQFAYEEGGCEVIGNIHDNPELLEKCKDFI